MPRGPGPMRRGYAGDQMATLTLRVSGMTCGPCQAKGEHVVGAQARSVEVSHAQAGLKRRSVKLFSTTLRLDHAIAALATTGDNRTWNAGYSAPAAIGMPMTLYTKAQKRFNLIVRMMRRDS